jgi:hypothetical protein
VVKIRIVVEILTVGGMHLRLYSFLEETHQAITIGQEDGGRIASSQNQDFGTIFYSPVSKIQHNDGPRVRLDQWPSSTL